MSDEARLQAIRDSMSSDQREEMAALISNELKRREAQKVENPKVTMKSKVSSSSLSSGLNQEQVQELYGDVNDAVKTLRVRKLERELEDARRQKMRFPSPKRRSSFQMPSFSVPKLSGELFLVAGLLVFGVGKVVFSSGLVDAEMLGGEPAAQQAPLQQLSAIQPERTASLRTMHSSAERELLSKLDARRVELENRSGLLDDKEQELKRQATALAEQLAELRRLTALLSERRVERDQRYESRMEQLANVYGSMAPKEAAPLIAQLDDAVALSLLKRLPGKRMGQLLSSMPRERAIELTLLLTDRERLG